MTIPTSVADSATKSTQLSLFTFQLDERIRRVEIDGVVHFSILDTFEYTGSIGSAKNPSVYWKNAKKHLIKQGHTLNEVLEYQFTGSDKRKKLATPVAPFKFFMRLAQAVDIAEWENVRQWMADVAHEQLEELANPLLGMRNAERRLEFHKRRYVTEQLRRGETADVALANLPQRLEAVDAFKLLTDEIKRNVINPKYGQFVNAEYKAMFSATADELRKMLESKSIRDALPPVQLDAIRSAEGMIRMIVMNATGMTMQSLLEAVDEIVLPMGALLLKASNLAGVHHVTGRPLLGGVQ